MPGPISYAAIALLARDRVREIRDAMAAKAANGTQVRDVERQIKYLAEIAYDTMTTGQPTLEPPIPLYGLPSGDQVSKFLMMGAVGPDLPGYAAPYADGQAWLRDTIHKGTPDSNREQLLAGSANLPLAFWRKVDPLLAPEFPAALAQAAARKSMQAYVLGHSSDIAERAPGLMRGKVAAGAGAGIAATTLHDQIKAFFTCVRRN